MSTYTVNTIPELTVTTPTEGASYVPEADDAIREIKRALKYQFTPVSVTSTTYTALTTSSILLVDADTAGGNVTVTLPTAASLSGRLYVIKKIDSSSYTVTVDGDGSETIDGATTKTIYGENDRLILISDGTNWVVLGGNETSITTNKTGNYTVTAAECCGRTTFSNDGASAEITFTLPTAVAGYRVAFIVTDAQSIRVAPGASDTIQIGGSTASTDIYSSTQGDSVELVAINATEWIALNPGSTTFTVN